MDDNIIAAIIIAGGSVLGAILGAILGAVISKKLEEKAFNNKKGDKIPTRRINKIILIIILLLLGGFFGSMIGYSIAKISLKPEPPILSSPIKVTSYFIPSGWMGDGKYNRKFVQFEPAHQGEYYPGGEDQLSIRISYIPGPEGFAGIYWQYPKNNWGDTLGIEIKKAIHISFWAKGEEGGEVVEFKSGGIQGGKYQDSYIVSLGKKKLSHSWKQDTLDLRNRDLSNVIGAFAWIASADDNPNGLTFYLDEIKFE